MVVGDSTTFTYRELTAACAAITDGATFVAASSDAFRVTLRPSGRRVPGGGALASYVSQVTGVIPQVVCGKPGVWTQRLLLKEYALCASRTLCVCGDVIIDSALGKTLGCVATVLVVDSRDGDALRDAERAVCDGHYAAPDSVVGSLGELIEAIGVGEERRVSVTSPAGGGERERP